ncbi:MAG: aminoacyl-tRNA hydrolase [Terracidiphilus sp.]
MAEAIEFGHPSEQRSLAGASNSGGRRSPFLIVGLGNPGLEYLWTPHNAGFMAIDRIAQQEGVAVQNRRCRATTATCRIAGRQVVLAKPETFMNLSGVAVAALVEEFEADPAKDLLVIYDELDLVLGTFKIRERGSTAGHNGARSVTGALGSEEWLRLRIGVAPDLSPHGQRPVRGGPDLFPEAIAAGGGARPGIDYLLSPMRKADLAVLDEVLDRVATAARRILEVGPAAAMSEFNRKDREQGSGNRDQDEEPEGGA